MNGRDRLRLLRKLTILVVLLVGFVLASSDGAVQQTLARPCCSQCEETEQYCYSLPEPESSQCLNDNFNHCWRWCSFGC